MIESMYNSNIADYVNPMHDEVEDPPEPFKTPMALLNERDPMHRVEERLDSEHMITHNNWGLYFFSTREYWHFEKPFQRDIIEDNEVTSEYDPGYQPLVYLPDIESNEGHETIISYSATLTHDIDEDYIPLGSNNDFRGENDETISEDETIISDFKVALEIEMLVQDLIEKADSK